MDYAIPVLLGAVAGFLVGVVVTAALYRNREREAINQLEGARTSLSKSIEQNKETKQ